MTTKSHKELLLDLLDDLEELKELRGLLKPQEMVDKLDKAHKKAHNGVVNWQFAHDD